MHAVFDRLFKEAVPVLMSGKHFVDTAPVEGGRWPVSVVCVPDESTQSLLESLMRQALPLAGPGHLLTGTRQASHFTIRMLEPYRESARPDDERARTWVSAVDATAQQTEAVRIRLTGVTLTTSGVMAQAEPVEETGWTLMRTLRDALGPEAWYEDQMRPREIWYSNILHFAAPIADPAGLIDWATRHRRTPPTVTQLDTLTLTRYRYRNGPERLMAMEPWHTAFLTRKCRRASHPPANE